SSSSTNPSMYHDNATSRSAYGVHAVAQALDVLLGGVVIDAGADGTTAVAQAHAVKVLECVVVAVVDADAPLGEESRGLRGVLVGDAERDRRAPIPRRRAHGHAVDSFHPCDESLQRALLIRMFGGHRSED